VARTLRLEVSHLATAIRWISDGFRGASAGGGI